MVKRPFFGLLGLGAGVTLGVWVTRRAAAVRARFSPQRMAHDASARAGALGGRLTAAVTEGRAAAAAREDELRTAHRVTRPDDLRDSG